jgi:hypothetical protein
VVVDDSGGKDSKLDPAKDPMVEVGGATDAGKGFIDWSDGQSSPAILRGPQGGQHIWVSVRARNVHPKKLRMAITMFIEETGKRVIPGRVTVTSTLKPDKDGWFLYQGVPSFVKCPCQIVGKKLRAELEIIDLYGRTASNEVWLSSTWDGSCKHAAVGSCKNQ